MKQFLSRIDYAGISFLVWGSGMPPIFYVLCCEPICWIRNIFFAQISFFSICAFLACMLPGANTPKWRPFRAYVFIALGISAAFPYIFTYNAPDKYTKYIMPTFNVSPYTKGGAIYIGGALCYAIKFPEKWFPVKFDLIG